MIETNRVAPPPPDLLDDAGLDFIANAPADDFAALVAEESGSTDALAARAGATVGRALKVHEAQRLHAQLRELAGRKTPDTRSSLMELAGLLHAAAASAGLVVSLQQMELESLSDEQLRALITRLQDICREAIAR